MPGRESMTLLIQQCQVRVPSGRLTQVHFNSLRLYTIYITDCIGSHFTLIRDDINPIILAIYMVVAVMLAPKCHT